ncbi:MAG: ATP-dependent zinc metalloprotease FtsH [Methylacidiphilales bacterium]|nr:ATP-dependent zinc metalloprotease FtsH [Candidatus Methylacidiphilales bacterium]
MLFFSLVIFLAIILYQTAASMKVGVTEMAYPQFIEKLEAGKVRSVRIVRETGARKEYLEGDYLVAVSEKDKKEIIGKYRTQVFLDFHKDLQPILAERGFRNIEAVTVDNSWWQAVLTSFLPLVFLLLIFYFIFRQQIRAAGKTAFSFGKSRARMLTRDKNKVTFKDVAGIEEAKDELAEIVEFLKNPKKFQEIGGRIPKGVLMVGPPGTGKTLLAKAIAGEADVPFFSISGSDFVEMFVGVGASRVRDMFEQGKRYAPCIIFIDEIDAVGRSRGTGLGGGHDEREQTLNALLVEMDGIESHEGIIIIAATNRKDVLDPALLRPGRFDREVNINLPDVKGREQILQVHARKVKLAPDVDLALIARGTAGFSGAELANLINEAALIAARRNQPHILQKDLEEARDKVRWGRERRSLAMSDEDKKITAYHEAGHAILNVLLPHTDPLHKVSIIPRGPALGVTMMLPEKDKFNHHRREIMAQLIVIMGGRIAEEIFIGDISSGAAGDIRMATWYARKMVCEWGMSENLGMVHYGDDSGGMVFLGRDLVNHRAYSEATAQKIDNEVLNLINQAYNTAKQIILEHKKELELLAQALLEYETLDGEQVKELLRTGRISSPPPKNLLPPAQSNPSEPLPASKQAEKEKSSDGLLPGLQGAPA